ncbi:hypothetical protein CPB86DRAFT_797390 [Serendipita vermifera]|nr:hypothetical protein CPB86DRAFT_797390 [Serendipita vermifera]
MSNGASSAVQRTPGEVWWMILDEAIDSPYFFATTYGGNNWSGFTRMPKAEQLDLYRQSEVQRKVLGSVCRSWQSFAQSRRSRYVSIVNTKDWEKETTRTARGAYLHASSVLDSPFAQGASVEWETLRLSFPSMLPKIASTLSCPHIRRLDLHFSTEVSLPSLIGIFPEITWLDCNVDSWVPRTSINTSQAPVVLPKLEVLRWDCGYHFLFPLSNLIFPSLRYIYLRFGDTDIDVPILGMLLPFRQSIESVVLRVFGKRVDIQRRTMQFPSWNDFPNLKELELDTPWPFHFDLLPSSHPLQKLNVQHGSFDAISSLMEGSSMRQLILQKARWTASGELMGRTYTMKLDAEKATKLCEKAKARGIRFEVSEDGEVLQNRQEGIAAAATIAANPLAYFKMIMK